MSCEKNSLGDRFLHRGNLREKRKKKKKEEEEDEEKNANIISQC